MSDTTFDSEVQDPLVPSHIAFSGHSFVQFGIQWLTESDFAFLSGEGYKAAIMLLSKSWQQTPAASLPDDDRLLANMAGFGRGPTAVTEFKKVKDEALSDFVLCSDGRFYSQALAPRAIDAWKNFDRTKKAREVKAEKRSIRLSDPEAASARSATDTAAGSVTETANGTTASVAGSKREEKKREDTRRDETKGEKASPSESYAFETGIIRLNERDWEQWKRSYPNLNLAGELTAMAGWAERLKAEGKNWFQVLPNQLVKKDREAREARERSRIEAESRARFMTEQAAKSSRPAI
jgi:hypothetical protein